MKENKDKLIIQVKQEKKEIELPNYGTIQIKVKDGKIIGSSVNIENKYY